MHFDLSDEQKAIADSLRALLEERLGGAKIVRYFDENRLDAQLWRQVADLECGGVLVPETQGGLAMGLVTLTVVAEVLGYYAAPVPMVTNALAAWLIAETGSDAQRSRWLEPLISGKAIAAFALAEPGNRWLAETWTASGARLTADKCHVEWGAEADLLIVGLRGGQLALVEPGPGVTRTRIDALDRTRPLANITLQDVPAEPLATDSETAARLIDAMLVLLAADACGAASSAMHRAVSYAKERVQFGRVIGQFQALKHQLADMAVEIEPSRPLCWYAAHAWDVYPERRRRIAALTKAHVTDGAVLVARMAIEAHGGIGYTWEHPIHVFLKRAVFDRAFMGTPRIHRERMAQMAGW